MDISEVLEKAWAAVDKAKVPESLRETAFKEAVRLMTPQSAKTEPAAGQKLKAKRKVKGPRAARSPAPEKTTEQARVGDADSFFNRLSEETGVARDKLERVIHIDQGVPRINMVARHLGSTVKDRQVVVGQILPVVRTYGLDESETSVAVIRAEADRLHILDTNLNTRLADLEGITYGGPGNARTLRVRPPGVKAFARIVDRLTSDGTEESQE